MEDQGQYTPEELVQTTSEQSETVDPAAQIDESAPSEKPNEDASERVPKGVQKRIDRLTREKYESKARADYLESVLQQQQQPQSRTSQQDAPKPDQYASTEEYVQALVQKELAKKEQASAAQEAQRQQLTNAQKQEKLLAEAEATEGFDLDHFSHNVVITPVMAEAIRESDMGAKLVVHLNANPTDATRIAALPPARQAAELGKLEAKLSIAPAPKSSAPKPINPLSGGGKASSQLNDDMSADDWLRARNAQLRNRG